MLKLCTWIRLKRCTCLWMCSDPDMFTVIFVLPSEHSPQPPYSKKLLVFSIMRSPPKKFTSIKVWNKKRGFAKPPNQQKLFSHILSYGTLPYVAHQMWTWGLEVVRPCRFSNIRKESWTLNCRPFVEKTHDVVFFSTVSVCNDFEGFKWFYINIYIYVQLKGFLMSWVENENILSEWENKNEGRIKVPTLWCFIFQFWHRCQLALRCGDPKTRHSQVCPCWHGMIGTSATTTVDYSEIPRPTTLDVWNSRKW